MSAKKIVSALALGALLSTGVAFAQTTTPTSTSPTGTSTFSTTTPGVPSTGAGGNAATNALILGASAAVVLLGGIYLSRRLARE